MVQKHSAMLPSNPSFFYHVCRYCEVNTFKTYFKFTHSDPESIETYRRLLYCKKIKLCQLKEWLHSLYVLVTKHNMISLLRMWDSLWFTVQVHTWVTCSRCGHSHSLTESISHQLTLTCIYFQQYKTCNWFINGSFHQYIKTVWNH